MRAFGKTGSGTSRSYRCINYCGVTKCINNSLSNENLVTYRTVRAFGKTGSGTSRSNCCVNYCGVTKCINNYLCYENLVTYGAMLTLGKTGLGTCSCNSCIDNLGVTKCIDMRINIRIITYRACVCCVTCVLTSRSGYNCVVAMSVSCNIYGVAIATLTSKGLNTLISASGSGCYNAAVINVNVINDTECTVTVSLTIEAVCTVIGNINGKLTAGDLKNCTTGLVGLVTVNVTNEVSSLNISGTAYDTLIAGKIVVPVINCESRILVGCAIVHDVTTLNIEDTVHANGNLLISSNCTLTYESNCLIDTNEENGVTRIVIISLSGRNCVTVKVKSDATSNLTVVSGLNVNILRSLNVLNKSNCVATYSCIKCILKRLVLSITDLSYCNLSRNVISNGAVAAYRTCIGCITLSLEGRSSYNCIILMTVSRKLELITNGTMLILNTAGSCPVVTKSRNYCLSNLIVASCTMRAFGKTGVLAIGSNCRVGYHIVTECINLVINVSIITYRTCVCCITISLTSRSGYNCVVAVTKRRNNLLSNLVVASCTMRAFGKTGVLAIGSNCRIGYHIVTECLDSILTLDVIATRAILICGVTGIQAICCLTCNVNKSMTESRNFSICRIITSGTGYVRIPTNVGTSSSLCRMINFTMTKCGSNYYRTYCTSLSCCTGCSRTVGVTLFCNSLLCNENFVTNRAVLTFSKTGCGTSRSYCSISNHSVILLVDCNCLSADLSTTYRTVNYAVVRTGSRACRINLILYNCSCIGVTGCRNFSSFYYFATSSTSNGCRTGCCTSCIYGSSCGVFVLARQNNTILNRVDHCSITVICSFNSNGLVLCCIDTNRCIFTIVT